MYKCSYCPFISKKKWNIQVYEARKHKAHSSAPTKINVGPNGLRAPTRFSIPPNKHPYRPRAPTTVSVPPLTGGVLQGSGI